MPMARFMSTVLSSALLFAVAGCAGNDGDDGAPGRDGTPGASGARGLAGESGKDGVNGKDGVAGANGASGANGKTALVATSDEPAGENCKGGGTRIDTGVDENDNGVLDDAEKSQPMFVCNGASGPAQRVRVVHELAGTSCAYGGVAIQTGLDVDASGQLEDAEVDGAATQYVCNASAAWAELPALRSVTTAYSFSLAVNDVDDTARLGFMFGDAAYRAELAAGGLLWDGGGVYSGGNVFGVYALQGTGSQSSWTFDHGRSTPQSYSYSELSFDDGDSYYTTNYTLFGGLVAVVKNGQSGTYALTPAFSTRRAHAIAFVDHVLYALIAQKSPGLTLSTYPDEELGELANRWTNLTTLETPATTLSSPELINAGGTLVGAYVLGGEASIRATPTPAMVAQPADFPEIGTCADAARVDLAWADGTLYAACIDGAGTLTLRRASLADVSAVVWEDVTIGIKGPVDEVDLSASGTRLALAVRQGSAVRVYTAVTDPIPSFDAVIAGAFDLQIAKEGYLLAVCDLTGNKTVRTFLH